jgi:hypothetical protein
MSVDAIASPPRVPAAKGVVLIQEDDVAVEGHNQAISSSR